MGHLENRRRKYSILCFLGQSSIITAKIIIQVFPVTCFQISPLFQRNQNSNLRHIYEFTNISRTRNILSPYNNPFLLHGNIFHLNDILRVRVERSNDIKASGRFDLHETFYVVDLS